MPRRRKPRTARESTGLGKMRAEPELFRKAQTETLSAVASVLGHESRNLLGALGTCVQILRRNPHMTKEDTELLDIIQSGADRLNEIVSELSTFANPLPPRRQPVDLHALIDETLIRVKRDERCSPSLVVNREFDPAVREVWADRELLGQALWHLCLNAVQAVGDRGTLRVETCNMRGKAEIKVRDTGPGIPPTVLPNVFEPLYSTKSRGAGLGLPIVRHIVEAHGGEVTVDSDRKAGTLVTLMLPVRPEEDATEE